MPSLLCPSANNLASAAAAPIAPRGGDNQRIAGQLIKESKESLSVDFNKLLGITFPEASATFVRAELPITDAIRQPYGILCMEALRSRCSKRRRALVPSSIPIYRASCPLG